MTRYFILSIMVHILPLLALLGQVASSNSGSSNEDSRTIIKKSGEDFVEIEPDGGGIASSVPHANDKCEYFFGGIGIQVVTSSRDNAFVYSVSSVHIDYPAYLAGIETGDVLYSTEDLRGEIGTSVKLIAIGIKGKRTLTLIRDKICVDSKN